MVSVYSYFIDLHCFFENCITVRGSANISDKTPAKTINGYKVEFLSTLRGCTHVKINGTNAVVRNYEDCFT